MFCKQFLKFEITLENVETSEKFTDVDLCIDEIIDWYKGQNQFQEWFRIDHVENNIFSIQTNHEYVKLNHEFDEDILMLKDIRYKVTANVTFNTKTISG
jgi:hypothetical protein